MTQEPNTNETSFFFEGIDSPLEQGAEPVVVVNDGEDHVDVEPVKKKSVRKKRVSKKDELVKPELSKADEEFILLHRLMKQKEEESGARKVKPVFVVKNTSRDKETMRSVRYEERGGFFIEGEAPKYEIRRGQSLKDLRESLLKAPSAPSAFGNHQVLTRNLNAERHHRGKLPTFSRDPAIKGSSFGGETPMSVQRKHW